MPNPSVNYSGGLTNAVRNTVMSDQSMINELKTLQTYSPPAMYCSYQNHSIIMDVSS